jgi:hypothetical protein
MNLTISIDQETLKQARMRALAESTSVNAVLRGFLERYAQAQTRYTEATATLLAISDEADSGSGPEGRTWTREDLYDRPVFRRH